MPETIYDQLPSLKSRLSFQPLLRLWKEVSQGNDTAAAKTCASLYQRFQNITELIAPISDYSVLKPHQALIEEAMTTIFPAAFSKQQELYAVAIPFSSNNIYTSSYFKDTYLDSQGNYLRPLDPQVAKNVATAKIHLAYKLILRKWYNIELIGGDAFISSYPEREHNIDNYFELVWDPQFIDITASFNPPPLPEEFLLQCHHVRDLVQFPQLKEILPLDHFVFDGLVITRIREVSERETVNNIRTILQKDDCLEDPQLLQELKQQIRYLLRMEHADIGFTAFYDAQNEVELPTINFASILLRNIQQTDQVIRFSHHLALELSKRPNYFWRFQHWHAHGYKHVRDHTNPVEIQLEQDGWESALLMALYHDQKVIGCLEIVTSKGEPVETSILTRLEHARELLQMALQQNRQQVQNKVNQLVKEHFTAVQSSVEWKFSNAAIQYLLQQHKGTAEKMASVIFDNVYPLYGVIDIKNSTGERNQAVQKDMLQQLRWIKSILENVQQRLSYPVLQEMQTRINKHITSISSFLFAADEQVIQNFLRTEATELLRYLADAIPDNRKEIEAYFDRVGPQNLVNEHRILFEQSVTEVNNLITRYLEQEQEQMQRMFPHYFERFVTDGVEFNIFIGQSISPSTPFHAVHLKNLRLWQLSFLATAAQRVHRLTTHLPLQTTQLVLVYNEPISIRFRNAERKFDVDGVRHAHYEIIKKRIDKAMIKGTTERLTQPGTIAIVYSNDDEAKEYLQYIDFLKTGGLLTGTPEVLDVEDLQAVSGLKALRVSIQLEEVHPESDAKKKKAA
ncbi:MAG: hypothetical protein ICV79_08810, partial [Flavisolibacter sp.]|nr:hypothetical protein [Flavisolibacter sp.]